MDISIALQGGTNVSSSLRSSTVNFLMRLKHNVFSVVAICYVGAKQRLFSNAQIVNTLRFYHEFLDNKTKKKEEGDGKKLHIGIYRVK